MQTWFRETLARGSEMPAALIAAVVEVEAEMAAGYDADLNQGVN